MNKKVTMSLFSPKHMDTFHWDIICRVNASILRIDLFSFKNYEHSVIYMPIKIYITSIIPVRCLIPFSASPVHSLTAIPIFNSFIDI